MEKKPTQKRFDLMERTQKFSKAVRDFVREIPKNSINTGDCEQLVRSSGAVGANYIEANGPLGKRDFLMRMRTSRKEVNESRYWLEIIDIGSDPHLEQTRVALAREAHELTLIFSAIVRKLSPSKS